MINSTPSVRTPKTATTPSPFATTTPSPFATPIQSRLAQRNFVGAPPRYDLDSALTHIDAAVNAPPSLKLTEETEALLSPLLAPMREGFTEAANHIRDSIKNTPVTANPLHQSKHVSLEFDTAIFSEPKGLQNLLNSTATDVLKAYDENKDGFRDAFLKAENLEGENAEKQGRELLENRLKAEQKRINDLRSVQQEIENHISKVANYMMQIRFSAKARMMAEGNNVEVKDGKFMELPKDGTYNSSGTKFSFMNAFLRSDYRGTLHKISNDGKSHSFNPKNKDSREFFKKCARGTPNVTSVKITLGTGVKSNYQMYGSMTPSTSRALREAALDFKFDFETGIPYDVAKRFFDKKGLLSSLKPGSDPAKLLTKGKGDVASMLNLHDELLDAYNKAQADYKNDPSAENKQKLIAARKGYRGFIKTLNNHFKDVDDYVLAADPIKAEIENFDLQSQEQKLYDQAKELREALKHMRGHAMGRNVEDLKLRIETLETKIEELKSKGTPASKEEAARLERWSDELAKDLKKLATLEEQFGTLHSGDLSNLKTDRPEPSTPSSEEGLGHSPS